MKYSFLNFKHIWLLLGQAVKSNDKYIMLDDN